MRPRLLDLFCGAGGAAMGYHRAGFDVVGVDLVDQPRYPFTFIRADVMDLPLGWGEWGEYHAVHASPPCQAYSRIGRQQRTRRPGTYEHPDLVAATRDQLRATGLPYIIENVQGAPLLNAARVCGSALGLDLHRHRLFECSFPAMSTPCSHHWQTSRFPSRDSRRAGRAATVVGVHGHHDWPGDRALRERAMGIEWMTPRELTQAIPPAYTEHIGGYLMAELQARAA